LSSSLKNKKEAEKRLKIQGRKMLLPTSYLKEKKKKARMKKEEEPRPIVPLEKDGLVGGRGGKEGPAQQKGLISNSFHFAERK